MTQDKVIVFILPPRWADGNMETDGLEECVVFMVYYTSEGSLLQYLKIISRGPTSSLLQLLLFFALTPFPPSRCPRVSPLCVLIAFHIAQDPTAKASTPALSPPITAGIEACLPKQCWAWTLLLCLILTCTRVRHSLCTWMYAKAGVRWHLFVMFCFCF